MTASSTYDDGAVVHRPARRHACAPGWKTRVSDGQGLYALPAGTLLADPPTAYDYPTGTVWQCTCGLTWVSTGSPAAHMPGACGWRREGRWERRRRLKREARNGG